MRPVVILLLILCSVSFTKPIRLGVNYNRVTIIMQDVHDY